MYFYIYSQEHLDLVPAGTPFRNAPYEYMAWNGGLEHNPANDPDACSSDSSDTDSDSTSNTSGDSEDGAAAHAEREKERERERERERGRELLPAYILPIFTI